MFNFYQKTNLFTIDGKLFNSNLINTFLDNKNKLGYVIY